MRKTPEHVQSAINECERLNVAFNWSIQGSKILGILQLGDKQKKVYMSKTPSDYRTPHKVRNDIRRIVREMRT